MWGNKPKLPANAEEDDPLYRLSGPVASDQFTFAQVLSQYSGGVFAEPATVHLAEIIS